MKKFVREFKEFALKGNMMDLAIGMIIGAAFTSIVNSLVNDMINPFLGLFTGQIDFSNLFLSLDGTEYATLEAAEAAGAAVIKYGSFLSNVINFIIMALVVFLIVSVLTAPPIWTTPGRLFPAARPQRFFWHKTGLQDTSFLCPAAPAASYLYFLTMASI